MPKDFLAKMKKLLKEEYDNFLKGYEESNARGLRVNTLKIPVDKFLEKSPFVLNKIPWVKEGFYYRENDKPGKHPYHEAGLYYIQEPSAMAVGEIVDPKPGEKVLDLCAAPGGKITHIASKMNQQGFLLANEIHPTRAKILSQNVERMGIKNAVVTNETPEHLAQRFVSYFDRILVDAPCSGEGMFRKNPQACTEWSIENVARCVKRQLDILQHAGKMLRPGGRLIYSTCTFSPEENEGVISKFVKYNQNFKIDDVKRYKNFSKGRADWTLEDVEDIEKTIRIWPHRIKGEGHYIAVLRKTDGKQPPKLKYAETLNDQKLLKDYFKFAKEYLLDIPNGKYVLFGRQLYIVPDSMLSLKNLKIIRPGWHLGTIKKNRFEPSHALALSLKGDEVRYRWDIEENSKDIFDYLKGETLKAKGAKGWYLVEVDGHSIGWGKLTNNTMKNHYPKGLRWR